MEDLGRLHEAFNVFAAASKSLGEHYEKLQEKVAYLTDEIAEKNLKLKEALGEAEEVKDYLRAILESLGEAIIVLDTDKHVTMINGAAEGLLKISRDEVLGKPFESLKFTIEREGSEAVLTAGGSRYDVILSCSDVADNTGGLRGHVILFQDITRIRELEADQERNHRLIAMGEMAAKIVHEIRSPLCSIELYATMLAKELQGTGKTELAQGISSGIRSLNNILTNMLLFARPNRPLFRDLDVAAVVDEALFMVHPMIEARGVRLRKGEIRDAKISGDSELIKQVLMNILFNAAQASAEGGSIDISSKAENSETVIEIKDEGEGIRKEDMERIFDPFFSTKEKGTGLGLAIATKIMQAHGGMIRVKSEPGKGSLFQLRFPLPCEAEKPVAAAGVF